jgi:ornithine cyclodeaminase
MRVFTNEEVTNIISVDDAITCMREAFLQYSKSGAMQARVRTAADGTTLSMMGAVLPGMNVAGAKVYTTINGKFKFAILLFSTTTGELLAAMEGDSMTEFRTAAVTAVATDALATKSASTLAVFGTGIQARAHIPALLKVRNFTKVLVVGLEGTDQFAQMIHEKYGVDAEVFSADHAASVADVIVTATRSEQPLFSGTSLKPGAFVAAIGSSKPTAREIDDIALQRAQKIVVEWKPQAKTEAGDLILGKLSDEAWNGVVELAGVVAVGQLSRHSDAYIIIYKAIGVGVEDVALAALAFQRSGAIS